MEFLNPKLLTFFRSISEKPLRYPGPNPPDFFSIDIHSCFLYCFLAAGVKLWFMVIAPSSPFLFSVASLEQAGRLLSPAPRFLDLKHPSPSCPGCQEDWQGLTALAAWALGTTSGLWSGLWNNLGFPQSFNRTSATKKWFQFRVNNISPSSLQINNPSPSFFFKVVFQS